VVITYNAYCKLQ